MYIRVDIWSCEIRFARILIVNVYKFGGFCFAASVLKRYWYLSPFLTLWKAWRLLCIFLLPFFFLFFCNASIRKGRICLLQKSNWNMSYAMMSLLKVKNSFVKLREILKKNIFFWESNGELQMATLQKRIRNNPSFLRLWRISHKTYERKIWCRLLNTAGTVM